MPYKSEAQRKYFHYLKSKGKMPASVVDDFDDHGVEFPEQKSPSVPRGTKEGMYGKGYAHGGMVEDEDFDMQWAHGEPPDTSGDGPEADYSPYNQGGLVTPQEEGFLKAIKRRRGIGRSLK